MYQLNITPEVACVLHFLSGELGVGSKVTKLHIVYHDDIAVYFDSWSKHYAL